MPLPSSSNGMRSPPLPCPSHPLPPLLTLRTPCPSSLHGMCSSMIAGRRVSSRIDISLRASVLPNYAPLTRKHLPPPPLPPLRHPLSSPSLSVHTSPRVLWNRLHMLVASMCHGTALLHIRRLQPCNHARCHHH